VSQIQPTQGQSARHDMTKGEITRI